MTSEYRPGDTMPPIMREQAVDTEKELSPEMVESILKKTVDIDQYGVAYSRVYSNGVFGRPYDPEKPFEADDFRSILKNGLLGSNPEIGSTKDTRERKKRWADVIRSKKEARVYFNIIGRDNDRLAEWRRQEFRKRGRQRKISESNSLKNAPFSISILLDDSKFSELTAEHHQSLRHMPLKLRQFKVDTEMTGKIKKNERGDFTNETEFGFVLHPRARPADFKGIVFSLATDRNSHNQQMWKNESRPEILGAYAEKIGELLVNIHKDKPDLLVPIYDIEGNMWWPKQMSYEEVKKFVAEKTKNVEPEQKS